MSKNGIRYSEEFKKQVIKLYHSGQPVLNLSREYGVATVTIYKWIKQFSPVQVSDNEEINVKEYQAMKKRIAELEMEYEILKKATAIFARKRYMKLLHSSKIQSSIYCKINLQSFKIP
ncbi:transposase [Thermoanaerobacterium thermosaccharolyticum]|uniref:Transposase n=1 Tax=Thermoanaerobacterium thermosaccharolyticum M0795 TaxID=698948 RepID=L0IG62_THETR|nr:transposase [Thermoanaerobacterium thermosaccharolyticum]AGB18530.1 transposase [Thermoanaerobacterium thermosaccharolyticum M0795]